MNYPAASGRGIKQKVVFFEAPQGGGVLNPSYAIKAMSLVGFALPRLSVSYKH